MDVKRGNRHSLFGPDQMDGLTTIQEFDKHAPRLETGPSGGIETLDVSKNYFAFTISVRVCVWASPPLAVPVSVRV
jgi:hypothetical protein